MERITLNMVPTGVLEICHASQYDIGREIRFDLIDGTDDFVLSGDEDITIFIRDFDGNLIESSAPNTSSNYVVWTSSEGELDVSGPAICELRVTKDDDVLGSANFIMEIEADAYDGTGVHVETVGPADICTFETTLPEPLQSVIVDLEATGGNGTPDNPIPINGYTEANITANGNTYTIAFGQTVYGGVLDVTRGKLHVTHGFKVYNGTENWSLNTSSKPWLFSVTAPTDIKQGSASSLYETSNLFIATTEIWSNSGYGILNNFNNLLVGYPDANADVDVLKTFLSNNNLQVCYQLETPFDIDLTPEVISAVVGTNNVFADCGETTVKYLTVE